MSKINELNLANSRTGVDNESMVTTIEFLVQAQALNKHRQISNEVSKLISNKIADFLDGIMEGDYLSYSKQQITELAESIGLKAEFVEKVIAMSARIVTIGSGKYRKVVGMLYDAYQKYLSLEYDEDDLLGCITHLAFKFKYVSYRIEDEKLFINLGLDSYELYAPYTIPNRYSKVSNFKLSSVEETLFKFMKGYKVLCTNGAYRAPGMVNLIKRIIKNIVRNNNIQVSDIDEFCTSVYEEGRDVFRGCLYIGELIKDQAEIYNKLIRLNNGYCCEGDYSNISDAINNANVDYEYKYFRLDTPYSSDKNIYNIVDDNGNLADRITI